MIRFLSTPSGWRATRKLEDYYDPYPISIHALRVEGDRPTGMPPENCDKFLSTPSGWRATRRSAPAFADGNFYPRPPGGGRPVMSRVGRREQFLSTPSGWRATHRSCNKYVTCTTEISIHALRVEGDSFISPSALADTSNFYPRPPGGGRQQKRTKFSSVFAQKGEEFASLRRGKRRICRWRFKKDKFWVLIWCEGSGKSVCALASHCG